MATTHVTMMVIFAGTYSGFESSVNVSGPMILPRQNEMRRVAFMVTYSRRVSNIVLWGRI